MFKIPNWMLNQSCEISLYQGNTATGVSYGTPTTYKCRFEYTSTRSQTKDNQELTVKGRVFLKHNAIVNEYSKLVFNGIEYKVTKIYKQYALNSLSHIELEVI